MSISFDSYQQKIIELDRGSHLVLAPPGCGKTAILAERVARAIEKGADPARMLCLTFTNRASRGMKERIETRTGSASEVFVGNTHRFCGHFLFENGIVEKSTGILDETDFMSVLAELYGVDDESRLTRDQSRLMNDAFNLQHLIYQFRHHHPDAILQNVDREMIGQLKAVAEELGMTPSKTVIVDIYDTIDTVIDRLGQSPFHAPALSVLKLARDYERYKNEHRLIDFDDMLLKAYDTLKTGTYKTYNWIQVDEVQDLNMLQLAIVELLADRDENVSVFLGDEQQSIFSFIGAKGATINYLRTHCGDKIHRLERNYRSPGYLLEMTNQYAVSNFGLDRELLPKSADGSQAPEGSLRIEMAADDRGAVNRVARMAVETPHDRRVAVIVATNREADRVSEALGNHPHFKISGTDFFATDPMQLLLSHLMIVGNEHNPLAWSKILLGLKLTRKRSIARRTMTKMMSAAVAPTDFLIYDEGSYLLDFTDTYLNSECVIFDTETTGLDINNDDIVQIAALKVRNGEIIDRLNIILHTDRPIPAMLDDIPNPLIKEYATTPHLSRREGLQRFIDFAAGAVLIGQNVEYDYNILIANLKRDLAECDLTVTNPRRFDTLKVARLLFPRLFSYKLKDLLTAFELEGENSHLADDDIVATKSVADFFVSYFNREVRARHEELLYNAADFRRKFHDVYAETYRKAVERLYGAPSSNPLSTELMRAYNDFAKRKIIAEPMDKLRYVVKFFDSRFKETDATLRECLDLIGADLNTFREADLCDGDIVDENIFITTVHKAKGLEFDNVVIFGAVDGTYPFFMSETEADRMEDARKLYVALTRARRSLVVMGYEKYMAETRYGIKMFDKELSPFLKPVMKYFQ